MNFPFSIFLTSFLLLFYFPFPNFASASQCTQSFSSDHPYCKAIDSLTFENCQKLKTLVIPTDDSTGILIPGFTHARTEKKVIEILKKTACEFLPKSELESCSENNAAIFDFCKFINHGYTQRNCNFPSFLDLDALIAESKLRSQPGFGQNHISQLIHPTELCNFGILLQMRKMELLASDQKCISDTHTGYPLLPPITQIHKDLSALTRELHIDMVEMTHSPAGALPYRDLPSNSARTHSDSKEFSLPLITERRTFLSEEQAKMKHVLFPYFSPGFLYSKGDRTLFQLLKNIKDNYSIRLQAARDQKSSIFDTYSLDPAVPVEIITSPEGKTFLNFPKKLLRNDDHKLTTLCIDYSPVLSGEEPKVLSLIKQKGAITPQLQEKLQLEMQLHSKIQEQMKASHVPPITQLQNILEIKHPRQQTEHLYLMEKLDTDIGTLAQTSEGRDSLSEHHLTFAKQLAEQLSVLHNNYRSHGDINPENILIQTNINRITLSQFDHSRDIAHFTPDDNYFGAQNYISPEMAKRLLDKRQYSAPLYRKTSDVFALGLVFYFLKYQNPGCTSPDGENNLQSYRGPYELCKKCKLFCDPTNPEITMIPHKGTFDHLIYLMLGPDPDERPTIEKVLKKLPLLSSN